MSRNPFKAIRKFIKKKRELHFFRHASKQEIFTRIYEQNKWGDEQTRSGKGSNMDRTAAIRRELPALLRELGIESILDIPCGDFYWMKEVDLGGTNYYGADIVRELIQQNIRQHSAPYRKFLQLNLLEDTLPIADAVLCRECLVHFSFADVMAAVENIRKADAKYLLTTHFPNIESNTDILTGKHRPLNLCLPPFNWPPALDQIDEDQGNGKHGCKQLAVWRVADLPCGM